MAAAAAVISDAPRSNVWLHLDRLDEVSNALNALRDLLIPADNLVTVDRGDLAFLLNFTSRHSRTEGDVGEMAVNAASVIGDLLTPEHDLRDVSRDNLCAMVDLLAHLQSDAMGAVREALQRSGT